MDRCNELCTKETTGQCALCDVLAERDQFIRFWFKGGWLIDGVRALKSRGVFDGVRALKSRGVFAFFVSRRTSLFLCLGALLLVLSIYIIYQYYWAIPNRQIGGPPQGPPHTTFSVKITAETGELTRKEVYELRNSIRQTFAQALGLLGGLIGGAVLLLGLYYTAQTLRTSQESLRVTQEGQITERFTKAIQHLGDKAGLTVRLGGIYALERIARDSAKDHWQIMEVLTAYVRDNAPWLPKDAQPLQDGQAQEEKPLGEDDQPSSSPEGPPSPKPATDIQAVLTVLGRRTRTSDREKGGVLDLAQTDLRRADLRGAHLEGALLRGTHLEGADLRDTHLEGADLRGAHLEGALPIASHPDAMRDFLGGDGHFDRVTTRFDRLTGLTFETRGRFVGHTPGRADFTTIHLEGADLRGAHLEGADLTGVCLEGAELAAVHLEGAYLYAVHLEGARLYDAHLERAQLYAVHLEGARLQAAYLKGADLRHAHLEGTNLSGAHLEEAEFSGAHLERAQLQAAHLKGARNLTAAQLAVVSSLIGVSLDQPLMEQLQREQPRLFRI